MPFHDAECDEFFSLINSRDLGLSESHDEEAYLSSQLSTELWMDEPGDRSMSPMQLSDPTSGMDLGLSDDSHVFNINERGHFNHVGDITGENDIADQVGLAMQVSEPEANIPNIAYSHAVIDKHADHGAFLEAYRNSQLSTELSVDEHGDRSMSPMQPSDPTSGMDLGLSYGSHVSNINERGHFNHVGEIAGENDMLLGRFPGQMGVAIQVSTPEANIQNPTDIDSPKKTASPGKGKPTPKTAGSGGARRTSAEKRKKPRPQVTATKVNGVLQIKDKLTKGYLKKLDILKKHITATPHTHKSLGGTVHPLLMVSSFKMTIDQHIAIARDMFPNTKVEKTARKNFSKVLCEIAMNSDPKTSKLGIYNVTYNEKQFDKTACYLVTGGNPSSGRPDFIVTVEGENDEA